MYRNKKTTTLVLTFLMLLGALLYVLWYTSSAHAAVML